LRTNLQYMKRSLLFLFLCVPFISVAQDLTGIWRGHFLQTGSMASIIDKIYGSADRYKFEVQLDQRADKFAGVTYSYKTTIFYGKASCNGTVNSASKKVLLRELKIEEVRMSAGSDACIMTLMLTYTKNGEEEFLEGTYTSMNTRDSSNCGRGTVFLRKVPVSDFYKEPFLVKREEEKRKRAITAKPNTTVKKPSTTTTTTAKKPATAPPTSTVKKPATTPQTTTAKNPTTTPPNTTAKKPAATTPTTTTRKPVSPPVASNQKPATPVKKDTVQKDVARTNPATVTKPAKVDSIKAPEKKIASVPVPKAISTRQNELVKTITVNTMDVTVDLYDNGTIDNDTVSVYLDKKLVVSKQRLTEKAITVKLKLDELNDSHELVMVAENLGEIPPNTSLMVVRAGDKQYEVRITSTEQKNAVVVFKYEKPG
jgi:hypothetical protein